MRRMVTSIVTGLFLVVPLAVLSAGSVKGLQLIVVSVGIMVFSVLVADMLKVSNYGIIV